MVFEETNKLLLLKLLLFMAGSCDYTYSLRQKACDSFMGHSI